MGRLPSGSVMYRGTRNSTMRHSITLGLAAIAVALAGCGSGDNTTSNSSTSNGSSGGSGSGSQKHLVIAVIPKGSTHEYWKSVHEGADKAASEIPNIEITWKGPMLENDRDSQIKVVEDFTTKG